MQDRICTSTGCGRQVKARNLCSTHYNRTRPNCHGKTMKPCDGCGTLVPKEARAQRYETTVCSDLCRHWVRWGTWLEELPTAHWARMYGAVCEWAPQEPRRTLPFYSGTCGECGASIVERAYGVPSRWCGRTCERRVKKRARRAAEHQAPGTFRYVDVMRQYHRQGMVCAYCMQHCAALPEPEHVVPLSRGGRNDMSNIVAACKRCNGDKGNQTPDEWAIERAAKGKPPLRTHLYGLPEFIHLMGAEPTGQARFQLAA